MKAGLIDQVGEFLAEMLGGLGYTPPAPVTPPSAAYRETLHPRVPRGRPGAGQWTQKPALHYGPGPHPDGSPQQVHAGDKPKTANATPVLTYEEWSKDRFGQVRPRQGIFEDQYRYYAENSRPATVSAAPGKRIRRVDKVRTYGDMKDKIRGAIQQIKDEGQPYAFYGLRFENQLRDVGDSIGNSRHNPSRLDERDFPEFGTDEYENLPALGGASSWHIDIDGDNEEWVRSFMSNYDSDGDKNSIGGHAYIIGGDRSATHSDADYNEIVIRGAVVIKKIF